MMHFISKFKIPTVLGLAVILIGIGIGVFLVLREQNFISQASPDTTPQNITFSNISETSAVISWQTTIPTPSFIMFGQTDPTEQTILDDRDSNPPSGGPKPHTSHYVTLKNLQPETSYQLKIVSGQKPSEVLTFTTAKIPTTQTGFTPIIGTVLDKDQSLTEGIVYLSINDAYPQTALIKNLGAYLIPISQIRKADLLDIYPLKENITAKLIVISEKGTASLLFELKAISNTLPALKIGENIDLTKPQVKNLTPTPTSTPPIELKVYDLNNDGFVNTADNAIILKNFGKNPQDEQNATAYKKADLNSDGVVDQEDLNIMSEKINQPI